MSVSLPGSFVPQVLSVMNGNIVALCGVDMEPTEDANSEENVTVGYPTVLTRSPLATCYGFGAYTTFCERNYSELIVFRHR